MGSSEDSIDGMALLQIVACVTALQDRLPDSLKYRHELTGLIADLMPSISTTAGTFEGAVREHGVELDRVLRPKPGEYD
ncbi:MAG TPA: hypothetical protein VGB75_06165 [Jatrophihabitans sp.]|jgi:hypothetical protein|uniref:hypothetical protein n=1 Tax=Jatrophihabitans sp. TaxID=1932789 RepID=UPI002EE8E878